MGKLDGQIAIIAGGGSGMGRATALAFVEEGARVALADVQAEAIKELAAEINGRGGQAIACVTDISRRSDVDALAQATLDAFGRIDTLVNTAGINVPDRKLTVLTPENWERMLKINLTGAFNLTQAVLPAMRQQKNGLLVHVTSVSGKWADFSGAAYQASKHGMVGLGHATMFEERSNGIRVTLIFPGLCDTPLMTKRPVPPAREVLDKALKPEDIAAACVFVASLPSRAYVPELILMPGALQCQGMAAI